MAAVGCPFLMDARVHIGLKVGPRFNLDRLMASLHIQSFKQGVHATVGIVYPKISLLPHHLIFYTIKLDRYLRLNWGLNKFYRQKF